MSFIKLDRGIVNSSVWEDRDVRDVFLTALLMAELYELRQPAAQLDARTMKPTGWFVPPGWYGMVEAAGVGIVRMAGVEREAGLTALVRMGDPEPESRADAFEGRRLVRVDGGYIALNYVRYREKDHGSAERQKRYRLRKRLALEGRGTDGDDARLGRLASLDRGEL